MYNAYSEIYLDFFLLKLMLFKISRFRHLILENKYGSNFVSGQLNKNFMS